MAFVPVVSAAVGIAGTVANSIQAGKNAARQNAAVQQQIVASAQSEAERLANVSLQKNFLLQDYVLSNYQRRATWVQQMAQIESEAYANNILQAQTEQALTADTATQLSGIRQAQAQNEQQSQVRLAQADQVMYDAAGNSIAMNQQSNVEEIIAAIQQGDIQAAAALAGNSGESRADQANARSLLTPDLIKGFQAIKDSGNISESAMQEMVMSREFSDLLRKVADFERTQGAAALGAAEGSVIEAGNTNRKISNISFANNRNQLAGAARMMPTQMRLDQGQANMNFIAGNQSLDAGGYNVIAQGAAERAQLQASMQSGPSFLQTAAGVTQAALPALSYFMQQRNSGASAVKTPVPLSTFMSTRNIPTVGSQYYPKGSYQDVLRLPYA
jgi:hypothetical protein